MNWTFCSSRLNLSKVIESKSFKGWYYPQTRRKQIISRRLLQKLEEIFLPKIPWYQTNVLRMEDYIIVVYVAYSSCRLATLDTWRMNISHTLQALSCPLFALVLICRIWENQNKGLGSDSCKTLTKKLVNYLGWFYH